MGILDLIAGNQKRKRKGRSWYIWPPQVTAIKTKNRVILARKIISSDGDYIVYEDLWGNVKTVKKGEIVG